MDNEEFLLLDKPSYLVHGTNDEEGYQIFTPEFIVKEMIEAIGKKEILDFSKTILEPTSGDGAFTGRILELRLKTIKNNFAVNSLKALSTIYSIEMDKEMVMKQRNNLYTIIVKFVKKKQAFSEKFDLAAKDIVSTNVVWGRTNIEDVVSTVFGTTVAYSMEKENSAVVFYTWTIDDDLKATKKAEEVEI
jgi:hypothetical protein